MCFRITVHAFVYTIQCCAVYRNVVKARLHGGIQWREVIDVGHFAYSTPAGHERPSAPSPAQRRATFLARRSRAACAHRRCTVDPRGPLRVPVRGGSRRRRLRACSSIHGTCLRSPMGSLSASSGSSPARCSTEALWSSPLTGRWPGHPPPPRHFSVGCPRGSGTGPSDGCQHAQRLSRHDARRTACRDGGRRRLRRERGLGTHLPDHPAVHGPAAGFDCRRVYRPPEARGSLSGFVGVRLNGEQA